MVILAVLAGVSSAVVALVPLAQKRAPRDESVHALSDCLAMLTAPAHLRQSAPQVLEGSLNQLAADLRDVKDAAERPETSWRFVTRAARRVLRRDPVRINLPRLDRIITKPELERRVAETYARLQRVRRDLVLLPPRLVPVIDVIEGDAPIRAYLADHRARAQSIEARITENLSSAATAPRAAPDPRKLFKSLVYTGLNFGMTSLVGWLSFQALMYHYPTVAVALPVTYGFLFGRGFIARVNRLYLNLKVGAHALLGHSPSAPRLDHAGVVGDIVRTLDDPDVDDVLIYAGDSIGLPFGQWDSHEPTPWRTVERVAPSPSQIEMAVVGAGWFLPADARRFECELIFQKNHTPGRSRLIRIVREAPYLQDHYRQVF